MPDISQINLPGDNNTYDIADVIARGRIWQGTQAQYNALTTIDPDTVYFITDAAGTVLATVATTGSYNDLTDKPQIDTSLDTTSSNAIANGPVASFAQAISQSVSYKMDTANPTGTGKLSLNRASGSAEGDQSVATGYNCTASGNYSNAGNYATTASGNYSHAEGVSTTSNGYATHAEGNSTIASNSFSHAEGNATKADGNNSHAEGYGTSAQRKSQHVFGEYNIEDTGGANPTVRGTYVEIVGKGNDENTRSNARTLDWAGNEVLAGGLKINGNKDVAIQSDFTPTAGALTNINSALTGGSYTLTRSGKICVLSLYKGITGSIGGTAELATLPSGFIPYADTKLVAISTYNGSYNSYTAQANANGKLVVSTGSGSFTSAISIIGTYICS